jgi:hypothetical protein
LLVVVGGAFAALTRRVAHRIGRSPNSFGVGDTTHDFVGWVYRTSGAILFVFLAARILWAEIDAAAGLIPILAHRRSPGSAWQ